MKNPLSGFWSDPRYTLIRHAAITGLAYSATLLLQAFMGTDFGPVWDGIIAMAAAPLIRLLTPYATAV